MTMGTGRASSSAMGWWLLLVSAIGAAALAMRANSDSSGEVAAAIELQEDAPRFSDGSFAPLASESTRVLYGDGTYFVGRTLQRGQPPIQRKVSRFIAKRLRKDQPTDSYQLRFTATEGNRETPLDAKPRPLARPSDDAKPVDDETMEIGLVMPDEGTVVINGTAPIIGVKRATVSSNGTKFAIEATPTHWRLVVLETTGNNPVLLYFPGTNTRATHCQVNDCWEIPNEETAANPTFKKNVTDPQFAALVIYANWILSNTP